MRGSRKETRALPFRIEAEDSRRLKISKVSPSFTVLTKLGLTAIFYRHTCRARANKQNFKKDLETEPELPSK